MTDEKLKPAVEAILFASGEPLPAARLSLALGVPEEDIFRPSTWNAFGTKDREGADFRACKALGALYGRY